MNKVVKTAIIIISGLDKHRLLSLIPDSTYVSTIYYLKTGKRLNLKNPVTFNEKLQWLKVNDHNSRYSQFVDKLSAKECVGSIIGDKYIVPCYKSWKNVEEISFSDLPNEFVLKCNHDQGSVIIVNDKADADIKYIKKWFKNKLNRNAYYGTREYPYKEIVPTVFAEKNLGAGISDYKFYCFNGEPRFLYVGRGLTFDHSLKIDFYDLDWNLMPFYRTDYERLGKVPKPDHLDEMIVIAKKLSKGTRFVRIDLFEVNGQVYFSEFTLCPASGYMPFVPAEYDEILGGWINLECNI